MISDIDLDEIIETCDKEKFQSIYRMAIELKERRESSLRPATKFLGNTIGEQLTQIQQELKEVEKELGYGCLGIDEAVEELIDLQTACETMLDILGLGELQRMQARRKVIAKNQARGYYCE